MELGPEDVPLLERCPHFRGWYVQASMKLGPEDVSLLERCPHFSNSFFTSVYADVKSENISFESLFSSVDYELCLVTANA